MKNGLRFVSRLSLIFFPFLTMAQPKKIRDELKRANQYEESKKMDTYHVYEKYLTTEQRYQLNIYYWELKVDVPIENAKNYWLLEAARDNNVCAQINMAYSYKVGRTVKKDSNKSRYWLLKAIDNQSASAWYYYGLISLNDVFSKSTNDSALFFLEKAREKNILDAGLALSFCLKYGLKTKKNDSLAEQYFSEYKNLLELTNNKFKENNPNLDSSIFCPTGFCDTKLIENQIAQRLKDLQSDSLLEILIESNGNSSYLSQQQSWDKAYLIRNTFIGSGLDPKRVSFSYGGSGISSIVKITFRKREEDFLGNSPPPPVPNLIQKYFILECK